MGETETTSAIEANEGNRPTWAMSRSARGQCLSGQLTTSQWDAKGCSDASAATVVPAATVAKRSTLLGDEAARDERARIAVFDYDGTIISGQSGALFASYLFGHGYLKLARALRLGWWGLRYALHLPYRQGEAREQVFSALIEHTPEEVHRIMMDFHDEVLLKRYRQGAINEMRMRKREGCTILLVSATFKDIAQRAAIVTGADDFVATDMERDVNGNYTGHVDGAVIAGPEKTNAVKGWADDHMSADAWTLAYSYADHHTDIDLLAASEKAYVVTPGKLLRLEARRRGWEVLDWS